MTFALMDDEFPQHRKVVALLEHDEGLAAVGLWALTLAWAKAQADPDRPLPSDGFVPVGMVRRFGGNPTLTALLDAVPAGYRHGLWERDGTGWRIHDFAEWQQIDKWRNKIASAKRGAQARWQPGPTLFDDATADANGHAPADADASALAKRMQSSTSTSTSKQSKSKPLLSADAAERFDEFWRTYPRRVGKGQAIRAWPRALGVADAATIIAGARRYAEQRAGQDPKFTRHPATWLNGQGWLDEPDDNPSGAVSSWEPN